MRTRWLLPLAVATLVVPIASADAGEAGADPDIGVPATADAASPGATAVPLRAAKPAWLTPELEAAVLAADGVPVQAPPDAPVPGWVGIRPGAWMISPAGCTMSFVFSNGGRLGIGTAGHCVEQGDDVIVVTVALGSDVPVLVDLGNVVIDHGTDDGEDEIGRDFALVEIKPQLHEWVSPTIAVIGGPCGAYSGSGPDAVLHYGHGVAVGTGGTPRAGLGLYYEPDAVYWTGVAAFGDSGGPVRGSDLSAVSNLTHLVIDTRYPGATTAGTSIAKIQQLAGGWTLTSSSLCGGTGGGGSGGDDGGGNGNGRGGGNGQGPKKGRPSA